MRSTMAPEMRAGVITANMAWNSMNAECGTVAASDGSGASPTPERPIQRRPPTAHRTPTIAMQTMERFMVWTTFFERTRPP